jgi:DNA (cytosine-5)-methyltransferase 1
VRLGSLCSGIGGLELGLEWALGSETVWQVELEAHCRAVLEVHWPHAERYDDVESSGGYFVWRNVLKPVDLICFGSPCQDLSSAGKRSGLSGSKSRLFYECARIVSELRPEWVVFENVASGAARWVDAVRQELEKLGYATLPVPIAASDCGAPHLRARVLLVAHLERAELRQQPGGAAGRTGKVRPSLHAIARRGAASATSREPPGGSARSSRPEHSPDAHHESSDLPAEARSEDAHASGHCPGLAPDVDREFGHAGQGEPRAERARRTEPSRGATPNALLEGREGPGPGAHTSRERPPAGCWRAPVPDILRVVHGVPRGLDRARDRIAALGNSCTPPQAEVAGHVIRILIEAERRRTA